MSSSWTVDTQSLQVARTAGGIVAQVPQRFEWLEAVKVLRRLKRNVRRRCKKKPGWVPPNTIRLINEEIAMYKRRLKK